MAFITFTADDVRMKLFILTSTQAAVTTTDTTEPSDLDHQAAVAARGQGAPGQMTWLKGFRPGFESIYDVLKVLIL